MNKLLLSVLSISLSVVLAGCTSKTIPDLDKLRSEDGLYTFSQIEWDTKPEAFFEAVGLKQPAEPTVLYDDESGEISFYYYRVSEVDFASAKWTADMQFDANDGLWAVSLMQSGNPDKLQKQFEKLDDALTDLYGEPDSANYNVSNKLSGGTTVSMDNISWHVLDENGVAVNVLHLGYIHIEGQENATLTLTPKWNEEGFATE